MATGGRTLSVTISQFDAAKLGGEKVMEKEHTLTAQTDLHHCFKFIKYEDEPLDPS